MATSHVIYGVELHELEKDEQNPAIPRFVVECVRIVESIENLKTSGIYRASGKKDSIDKIRKKVKILIYWIYLNHFVFY